MWSQRGEGPLASGLLFCSALLIKAGDDTEFFREKGGGVVASTGTEGGELDRGIGWGCIVGGSITA